MNPDPQSRVLAISNLEVVYHSVVLVLKGVSLELPAGSMRALLGPNGAGKTTVLRALTGLLDLHNGEVTKGNASYGGRDLPRLRADSIVRLGVAQVLEGRRILAELSVEENLKAGAWLVPSGQVDGELERMYARFPVLAERRKQQAGYLSGGEQQMLAIARALVSRPQLLLLDEPSLGLAPKVVSEVASLISEIHGEGVSVLLVEQNAAMALDLCEHAYLLENGRVVLDGPAEVLRRDKDVREFYLGFGGGEQRSYRDVKHYRRRRRWLS